MPSPVICLLVILVAGLAIWDLRRHEIPNWGWLTVLAIGLWIAPDGQGMAALRFGVSLPLALACAFWRPAFGMGDAKMLGAIAPLLGDASALLIFLTGVLAILLGQEIYGHWARGDKVTTRPLMPALAIGVIAVVLVGLP